MSVPYDFEKTLTEKTDEELSDMLAHEADYLPEALVAVRLESQRRNLSPAQIAQLDMQSQAILAQEGQAARQPLSWPSNLLCFCSRLASSKPWLPSLTETKDTRESTTSVGLGCGMESDSGLCFGLRSTLHSGLPITSAKTFQVRLPLSWLSLVLPSVS